MPSSAAARHTSTGSPSGSAAATRSKRRVEGGSGASRSRKLCSIRSDNGGPSDIQNPPASSAGVKRRGSSSSASGLPRVSATIRSRTRSSSGPVTTVASNSCASRSSSPPTASSASPSKCRSPLGSRTAKTSPTDSAPRRRATNASACAEAASSHCASSTTHTSGRSSATSESRLRTARPTRNRSGASPSRKPNAVPMRIALRAGKALQTSQERRAQLLQPRVRKLHLRLDSGRPGDVATRRVLRQILQQRALAHPGLPAQHQRPAVTRAHTRHQLIQRRALAAPAEQPRGNGSRHRHASLGAAPCVGNPGTVAPVTPRSITPRGC